MTMNDATRIEDVSTDEPTIKLTRGLLDRLEKMRKFEEEQDQADRLRRWTADAAREAGLYYAALHDAGLDPDLAGQLVRDWHAHKLTCVPAI